MVDPDDLLIKRAGPDDLDDIARVWHDSATSMDGRPDVPGRQALRSRIDAELGSGWELHVPFREKRVVGLLALKPEEASLDQIFVAPSEQKNGVGRALLHLAKQAMPGGFRLRMTASDKRARRFYENQGLQLIGEGYHPRTGAPVLFYGWNFR